MRLIRTLYSSNLGSFFLKRSDGPGMWLPNGGRIVKFGTPRAWALCFSAWFSIFFSDFLSEFGQLATREQLVAAFHAEILAAQRSFSG